jgi:hypothetical protein
MTTQKDSLHIAAFLDFDQKLFRTESSRLGFKYLWKRRMISVGFLFKSFVFTKDKGFLPVLSLLSFVVVSLEHFLYYYGGVQRKKNI